MKLTQVLSLPGVHLRVEDDHGVCSYWATHIDDQKMIIQNEKTGEPRVLLYKQAGAVSYNLTVVPDRLARVLLQRHLGEG